MSFLSDINIDLIRRKGWDNLKDCTVVFPMQRAGIFMKQAFMRQIAAYNRPVVLPRMVTLDELVTTVSELQPVDEIRAVCLLYHIYIRHLQAENEQALPLDAFYGLGRQLLTDFNNVDMAVADPEKILSYTSAARVLESTELTPEAKEGLLKLFNLDASSGDIAQSFRALWQHLLPIYQEFKETLQQHGLGTKGDAYRLFIDQYQTLQTRLDKPTYIFVGFNYLLPAEREVMALIHGSHDTLFYWDDDPSFHIDDTVYRFVRDNIAQFGNAYQPTPTELPKHVDVISTSSVNAQAQYVHPWLTKHNGSTAAIVLADESLLEAVLYGVPAELSGKVNITKGYPLRNTAVYAAAVQFLSDKNNDLQTTEPTYESVLQRLAAALTDRFPIETDNQEPLAWQQLVTNEALGQTLLTINRLRQLFTEGVLTDVTELRTLRYLVRRCLESISLPFHGEPVENVQIIGVLEARLLDFDNLLILNVEDGVLPATNHDNSLIPFDIRKAYKLQTHEEQRKIFGYNFYRLVRRAKHATLMFSESAGEMNQKSMSPFLMQMMISDAFAIHKQRLAEPAIVQPVQHIQVQRTWLDCAINQSDGKRVLYLSPSALSQYQDCPRQFYLRHIIGLREPQTETLILRPNEIGSLFHTAMQKVYEDICGGAISKPHPIASETIRLYMTDKNFLNKTDLFIQQAYESIRQDYDKHPAENSVIRRWVKQALEYDERLGNFTLCAIEHSARRPVEMTDFGVTVLLGGTIDRLDIITEDGQRYLRVLDYKTGSYNTGHKSAYVMQTMIYSSVCHYWAKDLNPQGLPIMPQLLFIQKLSGDPHVTVDKQEVRNFTELQSAFDSEITARITTILQDTVFEQCSEQTCKNSFCPFHVLCGRSYL